MSAAALTGVLFLVSMSKLYMLDSLPAWNSAYTAISFSLTALILGAMATAWVTGSAPGQPGSFLSALWTAAAFFIASDILFAALLTPRYGLAGHRSAPSLRPPSGAHRLLHLGRLALLGAGLILIVMSRAGSVTGRAAAFGSAPAGPAGRAWPVLTIALVLVIAAETAGRFLFYSLVRRPGD